MNLNDRVALILGRAIIHAEEMTLRLEEAQAKIAVLEAHVAKLIADTSPAAPPPAEPR